MVHTRGSTALHKSTFIGLILLTLISTNTKATDLKRCVAHEYEHLTHQHFVPGQHSASEPTRVRVFCAYGECNSQFYAEDMRETLAKASGNENKPRVIFDAKALMNTVENTGVIPSTAVMLERTLDTDVMVIVITSEEVRAAYSAVLNQLTTAEGRQGLIQTLTAHGENPLLIKKLRNDHLRFPQLKFIEDIYKTDDDNPFGDFVSHLLNPRH